MSYYLKGTQPRQSFMFREKNHAFLFYSSPLKISQLPSRRSTFEQRHEGN